MNLETNKILGGIGAILMFIGIMPVGNYLSILELIGAIMILIALYGIGNYYKDSRIFRNALYGIITGIIGVGIAVAVALTVIFSNIADFIYQLFPGWDGNWASLQGMTPDTNAFTSANFDPTTLISLIVGLIAVLAIIWIFAIIATFFIRRSLKQVTEKSNVGLFGTAGLLLLIGAFLTIVGIGLILMWIAILLLAIAFFQLKSSEPTTNYPPPPPTV